MHYWTDLYLTHDVDDEYIERAFADALRLGPAQVAIVSSVDADHEHSRDRLDWSRHTVLVQRTDRHFLPDDLFPVELSVGLRSRIAPNAELSTLQAIARGINTPFVSDLECDEEDFWHLFLPNGATFEVTVDHHDQFVLPPSALSEMAKLEHASSRAVG